MDHDALEVSNEGNTFSSPLGFLPKEQRLSLLSQLDERAQKVLQTAQQYFFQKYPEISKKGPIVIVMTGSDARKEKDLDASPVEVIAITSESSNDSEGILEKLKNDFSKKDLPQFFYPDIEIKKLFDKKATGLISEHVGQKKVTVIPTRALDAVYVAGNPAIVTAYKTELVREIVTKSVKLNIFSKDFVLYSRRTLKNDLESKSTGKASHHFIDCKNGCMFMNGVDAKGVKYGALRFLQYSLAYAFFKHLENLEVSKAQELVVQIPQDTYSRIAWIKDKNICKLDNKEVQDFQTTYIQLLSWYLTSQQRLKKIGEMVEVKVIPEALQATLETALTLGENVRSSSL